MCTNIINNVCIHHENIPYEISDCEDKVVILRPTSIDDRMYKATKAIMHYMKENCGAKEVLVIPDNINYEILDIDTAIYKINELINELHSIKDDLCENEEKYRVGLLMHNIKAYNIRNCKITRFTNFSGIVLNINGEPIINSVKRKVGLDNLFCETINEEIKYSEISLFSISLSELTLGDLLLITGNYNISTKLT